MYILILGVPTENYRYKVMYSQLTWQKRNIKSFADFVLPQTDTQDSVFTNLQFKNKFLHEEKNKLTESRRIVLIG